MKTVLTPSLSSQLSLEAELKKMLKDSFSIDPTQSLKLRAQAAVVVAWKPLSSEWSDRQKPKLRTKCETAHAKRPQPWNANTNQPPTKKGRKGAKRNGKAKDGKGAWKLKEGSDRTPMASPSAFATTPKKAARTALSVTSRRAYSAGGGLGFGLNIVTTSGLHPRGGGGQQPEPHVQRFWFNPTLT